MKRKQLIAHILLGGMTFFMAMTGMYWLMLLIMGLWMVFYVSTSSSRLCVAFRRTSCLAYPLLLLFVFISAIVFKSLFLSIYKIPSSSMDQTIKTGDIVWVNKLVYGPKLPSSLYDIPWVNVLVWLTNRHDATHPPINWLHIRLKGFSRIKVGDIFVFEHPDLGENFIKRCMGAPGDTLQLINAQSFINHHLVSSPPLAQFYSRVELDSAAQADTSLIQSLIINQQGIHHNNLCYGGMMFTECQLERFRSHPLVKKVTFEPRSADTIWLVYPFIKELNWDIDNYGPVVIPCISLQIELDTITFALYQSIIRKYEGHDFYTKDNLYYLDGQPITHYEFSNDYCFAMGDNRHDSNDSRYFGFVPMKNVVGKASCIIYSPIGNMNFFNKLVFSKL